jgi:type IV secretory pathway TraG/TraD family ATPase VirD4
VLHGAALDGASLDVVVSAINRHDADRLSAVLARNGSELALDLLSGILATDAREQSGIWSTASGVLAGYRTRAALLSAGARPFDACELVRSRATLYLAASSEHQRHVAPLVAGLVRDVRSAAYEHAARRYARGTVATAVPAPGEAATGVEPARAAPSDAPLLLVLDELAGIAPLHDLPTLIAEGASQGVLTLACLQDLSQARSRWGSAADGFLTLFGTKVVLPGIGDTRTLEALSLLAGDRDVPHLSTTRGIGLLRRRPVSRTVGTQRVRRLPPDSIASAPRGSALVYVGTRPGRVLIPPYGSQAPWRTSRARAIQRGDTPGLGRGR